MLVLRDQFQITWFDKICQLVIQSSVPIEDILNTIQIQRVEKSNFGLQASTIPKLRTEKASVEGFEPRTHNLEVERKSEDLL